MSDESTTEDARFADEVLARLPTTPVPPALEARILADFDHVAAARAPGAVARLVRRWQALIWPGAPAWKPASALALSLIVGMMAGVLVPSSDLAKPASSASQADQQTASGDAPPIVNMTGDL